MYKVCLLWASKLNHLVLIGNQCLIIYAISSWGKHSLASPKLASIEFTIFLTIFLHSKGGLKKAFNIALPKGLFSTCSIKQTPDCFIFFWLDMKSKKPFRENFLSKWTKRCLLWAASKLTRVSVNRKSLFDYLGNFKGEKLLTSCGE